MSHDAECGPHCTKLTHTTDLRGLPLQIGLVDSPMGPLSPAPRPYVTKDSGERQEFETGAKRDTQAGKPRYDLVPVAPLKRLAELYARGAEKYDDHNWTKGIPVSRFQASAMRHWEQYRAGDTDEDHLAAVLFNVMGIMHFQGSDMDDAHDWGAR